MKTEDNFTTWLSVIIFIIIVVGSLILSAYKINQNNLKNQYEAGYITGYEDALQGKESKFEY